VLAARLDTVLEERDELVAEVDERHAPRAAAELQIREERPPELECLVDAADVERDVIDADGAWHV
jgi:hypothetical protein